MLPKSIANGDKSKPKNIEPLEQANRSPLKVSKRNVKLCLAIVPQVTKSGRVSKENQVMRDQRKQLERLTEANKEEDERQLTSLTEEQRNKLAATIVMHRPEVVQVKTMCQYLNKHHYRRVHRKPHWHYWQMPSKRQILLSFDSPRICYGRTSFLVRPIEHKRNALIETS